MRQLTIVNLPPFKLVKSEYGPELQIYYYESHSIVLNVTSVFMRKLWGRHKGAKVHPVVPNEIDLTRNANAF